MMNTTKIALLILSVAVFALTACDKEAPSATKTATTDASDSAKSRAISPVLVASIQDLMKSEIDPAANYLWNSVSTLSTDEGLVENQPRTDEDWQNVRMQAIKLIEAANLLMMPGRSVVEGDGRLDGEDIPGNLSAAEIQQLIDKDPASFAAFARGLQLATQGVLRAVDTKNADALFEAGGPIDTACEACHQVYWYPDQGYSAN